jgi:hypothetical protein
VYSAGATETLRRQCLPLAAGAKHVHNDLEHQPCWIWVDVLRRVCARTADPQRASEKVPVSASISPAKERKPAISRTCCHRSRLSDSTCGNIRALTATACRESCIHTVERRQARSFSAIRNSLRRRDARTPLLGQNPADDVLDLAHVLSLNDLVFLFRAVFLLDLWCLG